jgi:hypothetical protein
MLVCENLYSILQVRPRVSPDTPQWLVPEGAEKLNRVDLLIIFRKEKLSL